MTYSLIKGVWFWVLHPVARVNKVTIRAVPPNNSNSCLYYLCPCRSLLAIFRRNTLLDNSQTHFKQTTAEFAKNLEIGRNNTKQRIRCG
jgi:hypothetical protein